MINECFLNSWPGEIHSVVEVDGSFLIDDSMRAKDSSPRNSQTFDWRELSRNSQTLRESDRPLSSFQRSAVPNQSLIQKLFKDGLTAWSLFLFHSFISFFGIAHPCDSYRSLDLAIRFSETHLQVFISYLEITFMPSCWIKIEILFIQLDGDQGRCMAWGWNSYIISQQTIIKQTIKKRRRQGKEMEIVCWKDTTGPWSITFPLRNPLSTY